MLPEPSERFVYAKPCKREHETACMLISIAHYQEAFNQLRQVGAERDDLRKRLQSRIAALEAEREKLREMVMKLANEVDCTNIASLHRRKPLVDQAKALVGGEVKK